jgi:uncharacterized protein (DUF849 family)
MFLKACINGARLPLSPAEIAREGAACLAAGASAIHAHVYADGIESLAPDAVDAAVRACPFPIGISTGAWIRDRRVAEWYTLPAFASVNFIEEDALDVARMLFTSGVEIEAGLSDAVAARRYVESGIPCIRILLEPQEQSLDDALRNVAAMETIIEEIDLPRVLHGFDATAWPLIDEALRRGYGTRIGFEDTLLMRDGTRAESNAALITAVRAQAPPTTRPEPRR